MPDASTATAATPTSSRDAVLLLAPGSGGCGKALEAAQVYNVHLAVNKEYDISGRRYPPGWATMHGVALDEDEAAASGIDSIQIGFGRASPRNLATWARRLYDRDARRFACIDLSSIIQRRSGGSGGDHGDADDEQMLSMDATEFMRPRDEASFRCLVCGSRGGQVTLPALWLLGCRMPAVVLNGGCCRADVAWTWPEGVPLVLLTGGRDYFNQHMLAPGMWDLESDLSYRRELWDAVPAANRESTAILHLPRMSHVWEAAALEVMLTQAVRYAAAGLVAAARPDGAGLPEGEACLLLTAASAPEGELLCGELAQEPPPAPTSSVMVVERNDGGCRVL